MRYDGMGGGTNKTATKTLKVLQIKVKGRGPLSPVVSASYRVCHREFETS